MSHFLTIEDRQEQAYKTSASKGWHEHPMCAKRGVKAHGAQKPPEGVNHYIVGTKVALIHAEVSEAMECVRENDWLPRIDEETGKPEGFAIEMADAVIRIMDTMESLGLSLEQAIRIKMEYNRSRPHKHGGKAV